MERVRYQPEELIPMVAELAEAYTGNESTSITYERAQQLMEAVIYCIRENEEENGRALSDIKEISARKAYQRGKEIVISKTRKLQKMYNQMVMEFQDYGLECLQAVFFKGIPAFLLYYDVRFAPQETILTLDYPVLKNLDELSGVDRVLSYVKCLELEQRFLQAFGEGFIRYTLKGYCGEYEGLIENICSLVFQNVAGYVILDKPLEERGITAEEYEELELFFRGKSEDWIKEVLLSMVKRMSENDSRLAEYISLEVDNTAKRIWNGLENHCLQRVFF